MYTHWHVVPSVLYLPRGLLFPWHTGQMPLDFMCGHLIKSSIAVNVLTSILLNPVISVECEGSLKKCLAVLLSLVVPHLPGFACSASLPSHIGIFSEWILYVFSLLSCRHHEFAIFFMSSWYTSSRKYMYSKNLTQACSVDRPNLDNVISTGLLTVSSIMSIFLDDAVHM